MHAHEAGFLPLAALPEEPAVPAEADAGNGALEDEVWLGGQGVGTVVHVDPTGLGAGALYAVAGPRRAPVWAATGLLAMLAMVSSAWRSVRKPMAALAPTTMTMTAASRVKQGRASPCTRVSVTHRAPG